MNKIVEYLKDNEKVTKAVTSAILFFAGLGLLFVGMAINSTHLGFCITLCLLGIILGFLGAVPLICLWTAWQDLD